MAKHKAAPPVYTQREGGVYFMKFAVGGVSVRRTTGTRDKAEAQKIADMAWHAAHLEANTVAQAKGTHPHKPKDMSLDHIAEAYAVNSLAKNPKSEKEALRRLAIIVQGIGPDTMATEITTKRALEYAMARSKTQKANGELLSPVTVNGELLVLQGLLNYAAEIEEIPGLPRIAWSSVKRKAPTRIPRRLTLDEQQRIIDTAPDDLRRVIEFCLETGIRRESCCDLLWSQIDMDSKSITFIGKGDKITVVHITSRLAAILAEVPRVTGIDNVWTYEAQRTSNNPKAGQRIKGRRYPMNYWTFGADFAAHVKSLGIKCKLHDLRKTFGSEILACEGIEAASKALNHSSIKVTQDAYAAFLPQEERDMSDRASAARAVKREARPAA